MITAKNVLEAAQSVPRWGSRKVLVCNILAAVPGLTKDDLVRMHRAGEIKLSRADLDVGASQAEIAASRISYMGVAEWHAMAVPPKALLDAIEQTVACEQRARAEGRTHVAEAQAELLASLRAQL